MTWKEQNNQLAVSLKFKDFAEAWNFMTEVAIAAEKLHHHPTWTNTYNKVDIVLCTHDVGNIITQKDRMLAEEIEKILAKYQN
jgi:4a-hydroxytetrahydrobiopterin dehydratase